MSAEAHLHDRLAAVGARLAGAPLRSLQPARRGANNRLFRLETTIGQAFALKCYPRLAGDPRDRLSTEFGALTFLRRHGIADVPTAIAADRAEALALYEWIEGDSVLPSPDAIDEALALIRAMIGLRQAAGADRLPLASEACLAASDILHQVDARLARLSTVGADNPALQAFLKDAFRPAAARLQARARTAYANAGLAVDEPILSTGRCLSPSDFGFHNALRRRDGRLCFLDFEYFGWDDPVKLAADFVLHPGMDLTDALKQRFLAGFAQLFPADAGFHVRLLACLPLYALRWTMILLNEFLPERWERRVLAGFHGDRAAILDRQLRKAVAMLARAESEV